MTTELTSFLNAESTARIHQNLLNAITRRASRLWEDGYTCSEMLRITGYDTYTVTNPAGKEYLVFLSDTPTDPIFGDHCECQCFAEHGECQCLHSPCFIPGASASACFLPRVACPSPGIRRSPALR